MIFISRTFVFYYQLYCDKLKIKLGKCPKVLKTLRSVLCAYRSAQRDLKGENKKSITVLAVTRP